MRGEELQRLSVQQLQELEKTLESGLGSVLKTKRMQLIEENSRLKEQVSIPLSVCFDRRLGGFSQRRPEAAGYHSSAPSDRDLACPVAERCRSLALLHSRSFWIGGEQHCWIGKTQVTNASHQNKAF
ncbi:MADS-box transcription factor 47 [Zea mays]|nr:MADS-box transcription factor 47 [Zea mays]